MSEPAANPPQAGAGATVRILVVEDHPINQDIIAAMLAALGHDIDMVDNGPDALQKFREGRYTMILLDWRMPGMDGLEVLRTIRRMEAEQALARTPVMVVSASALGSEVAHCMAAGADAHLPKPFRLDELRVAVDRLMPVVH